MLFFLSKVFPRHCPRSPRPWPLGSGCRRSRHRFHDKFALAVDLINARRVNFAPLLTEIFPVEDAVKAFEAAGDRSKSMKAQLTF
jgi:threonine dehydrogenase-like Zn-dependent dehydrogenase